MRTYHVYKFQNLINGKIYVGKSINIKKRYYAWQYNYQNKKEKHVSLFSRAITKYGFDKFSFEILGEYHNTDDMDNAEMQFINEFNCVSPHGYNLQHKLEKSLICHETSRSKMSKSQQGLSRKNKMIDIPYIGVRCDSKNKFSTRLQINRKSVCRNFDTVEDAAMAYDKIMLFLHGPDARINFEDRRDSFLMSDLTSFYSNFLIPKNKKYTKYVGVNWIHKNKKWGMVFDRTKPEYKGLRLKQFTSETEAAEYADMLTIFLKMNRKINFSEKINDYNKELLEETFKNIHLPYTSDYKGVAKSGKKWRCYCNVGGKQITISSKYLTAEEAYNALLVYKKQNNIF